jgi:excinuclease ABC subunit B
VADRAERGERVLITTLTKRLAEDLAEYMIEAGHRCQYLHSELDAIERVEILHSLREGEFDALVGVNLLREGLDLPEVTLVAILDADKQGFLRSRTSLIQTIGRTARNVSGRVILYADEITESIQATIDETERRRARQLAYNEEHGITPQTVKVGKRMSIADIVRVEHDLLASVGADEEQINQTERLGELEAEMFRLAEELKFEEAAALRDQIQSIRDGTPAYQGRRKRGRKGKSGQSAGRPGKLRRR